MFTASWMPSDSRLRRAVACANVNAALWGIGSGLAPTVLVTYLAMEFGAEGIAVSLVVAAPRFAGCTRLLAPKLIEYAGAPKWPCLGCYAVSVIVLAALSILSSPARSPDGAASLAVLVACWSWYQVTEYLGSTILWSWLGETYPARIRGRLLGVRDRQLVLGQVIGSVVGFSLTYQASTGNGGRNWQSLCNAALLGAAFMGLAVVPLALMPLAKARGVMSTGRSLNLGAVYRNRAYNRLVLWSAALSVSNGIAAAARGVFPYRVLGVDYPVLLTMSTSMKLGQSWLAPVAGRWSDQSGARRVLIVTQGVTAVSPIFFLLASPHGLWWIAGAYVAWIAYAGVNVGLDSLKLSLASEGAYAPALSIMHAVSDTTNGATIIIGGVLLEWAMQGGPAEEASYQSILLLGLLLRAATWGAAFWLPDDPSVSRNKAPSGSPAALAPAA